MTAASTAEGKTHERGNILVNTDQSSESLAGALASREGSKVQTGATKVTLVEVEEDH